MNSDRWLTVTLKGTCRVSQRSALLLQLLCFSMNDLDDRTKYVSKSARDTPALQRPGWEFDMLLTDWEKGWEMMGRTVRHWKAKKCTKRPQKKRQQQFCHKGHEGYR